MFSWIYPHAAFMHDIDREEICCFPEQSNVRFLGMVRRTKNARPVGMFVCDCSLTSAEVMAKYQTAEHKFESLRLRAVPLVRQLAPGGLLDV